MYVFGYPPRIGGHYKSALAMVRNLEAMGHHVIVLSFGAVEEMVQEFTSAGAEFFSIPELKKYPRFPTTSGVRRILRIGKECSVDIIHAQDFPSIGCAHLAAVLSGKAFVLTIAGGPGREKPLKRTDTVFFSREQLENSLGAFHMVEDNLHLIRARIDRSTYKPEGVEPAFIRQYAFHKSEKKIVMTMRLSSGKKPWLKTILETAKAFSTHKKGVHIVVAGEGPLLSDLREKAARINTKSKAGPVLSFIGPIFGLKEINRFYNCADIVIGHGRGILEAMACGKCVVVLGENGEAEVVKPENVDNIAYYNFSGRHFRYCQPPRRSLAVLLENLLNDVNAQKRLADFSYEYVRTQMDAQIGAEQLVEVYKKALNKKPLLFDYVVWDVRRIFNRIILELKKKISFKQFH